MTWRLEEAFARCTRIPTQMAIEKYGMLGGFIDTEGLKQLGYFFLTEDVLDDVVAVLVLDEGLEDGEDLRQDSRPLVLPHLLQQPLNHPAPVRITAQLGDLHRDTVIILIGRRDCQARFSLVGG